MAKRTFDELRYHNATGRNQQRQRKRRTAGSDVGAELPNEVADDDRDSSSYTKDRGSSSLQTTATFSHHARTHVSSLQQSILDATVVGSDDDDASISARSSRTETIDGTAQQQTVPAGQTRCDLYCTQRAETEDSLRVCAFLTQQFGIFSTDTATAETGNRLKAALEQHAARKRRSFESIRSRHESEARGRIGLAESFRLIESAIDSDRGRSQQDVGDVTLSPSPVASLNQGYETTSVFKSKLSLLLNLPTRREEEDCRELLAMIALDRVMDGDSDSDSELVL